MPGETRQPVPDEEWNKFSEQKEPEMLATVQTEIRNCLFELHDLIKAAPEAMPNKELLADVVSAASTTLAEAPTMLRPEKARDEFLERMNKTLGSIGYITIKQSRLNRVEERFGQAGAE